MRRIHPIETESYRILREIVDLSHLGPLSRAVAERVIHASADLDYAESLVLDEAGHRDQWRADLDLQISLLAEHEITRLITLVTAIAERLELDAARNPELAELAQDVAPEKVMEKMEAHERAIGSQNVR